MSIKVLVLDDEPEILESMRRLLELDGRFEVFTTDNPQKALELVSKENIQIVFCDIVMPEMDGLEFLEAAKAINGLIQVVMMTAYSTVDRVLASFEKGAADYLMKPFSQEEISEILNDLVKRLTRWRDLVVKARGIQDGKEISSGRLGGEGDQSSVEEALESLEKLVAEGGEDLPEKLLSWLEKENRQLVKERLLWELSRLLTKRLDKNILERMFTSSDPFIRNGAIELGRELGPDSILVLLELLEHPNKDVRKLVLDLAANVRAEEVKEVFEKALLDPDPNVRMTAIEYLGERGTKECVSLLEEQLFKEEEPMLLATLFETLAQLSSSPRSREIIEHWREKVDFLLLHSFLKYLGAFGNPDDLSWLEEGLKNKKIKFSRELVDALFDLCKRHPELKLSPYLISLLEEKALEEEKTMGVYQILQLLYLQDQDRAVSLARKLETQGTEEQAVAAKNFLAEINHGEEERDA